MRNLIYILIILAGVQAYSKYQGRIPELLSGRAIAEVPAPEIASSPTNAAPALPSFRCDGRTHCSQMTSCEEATFFLRNCPDVKMDGNGDGVPCEKQWCR
jgi:hypothetical protein